MTATASTPSRDLVCIVDDEEGVRNATARLLRGIGVETRTYGAPSDFLQDPLRHQCKCVILDVRMPQMSGLKLQSELREAGWNIPIIFITGHADVPMAVEAMRHGAIDFLEKPFSDQKLLDRVQEVLTRQRDEKQEVTTHSTIEARLALLTPREQEVMTMLVDGCSSKVIADKLRISVRTVEDHRANILKKLHVPSVVVLIGVLSRVRRA